MAELSKEYASALFSLALEAGVTQQVSSELAQVQKLFETENGRYIDFLNAPSIPKEDRLKALDVSLKDASPIVRNFVKLLCQKGHIRALPDCIAEYELLYKSSARISVAHIRHAAPLSDDQKQRLKEKLQQIAGHKVIMIYIPDPSLIGGMVVEMDSRVYDGSLRKEMKEVKEVIAK